MSGYDVDYSQKKAMVDREEETGAAQREVYELHKRLEHLQLIVDNLEAKLRTVLRTEPEPGVRAGEPDAPHCSLMTESLRQANQTIARVDLRIADMITRCEL